MSDDHGPLACSLPTGGAALRLREWAELTDHAAATERVADGVVMTFGLDQADRVEDLADREAR
ncbi:MAG: hypothetical protein ACE5GB_05150, partial [Acidimicrobiales bacterium]